MSAVDTSALNTLLLMVCAGDVRIAWPEPPLISEVSTEFTVSQSSEGVLRLKASIMTLKDENDGWPDFLAIADALEMEVPKCFDDYDLTYRRHGSEDDFDNSRDPWHMKRFFIEFLMRPKADFSINVNIAQQ